MDQNDTSGICSAHFSQDLSRLLDNGLSPRRRRRLERHLQACPHCREHLRQLEAVQSLLRRAEPPLAPRDFVLSPAMVRRPGVLWYPRLRAASLVMAVVVLLFLLGGMGLSSGLVQATPTARPIAAKPTPLVTPPPASVAVAPAITRRPAPTTAGLITPLPAHSPAPYPTAAGPRIEVSGTPTRIPAPRPHPSPPTTEAGFSFPWTELQTASLSLLGLLLGLTWVTYRRERRFLP